MEDRELGRPIPSLMSPLFHQQGCMTTLEDRKTQRIPKGHVFSAKTLKYLSSILHVSNIFKILW